MIQVLIEKRISDNRWIIALCIFLLAAALRTYGLRERPVFNDEPLWFERSQKVIAQLKTDPLNATTHLPHPGIGAVMLMVTGEVLANSINSHRDIDPNDPGYLHPFDAATMVIAIAASLLGPIIFIGTLPFFSALQALLIALIVSLEPLHLGASRMLHIDAMLSVYLWLAVLSYVYAVEYGKPRWKILAGLAWGLALSIKPNAAFVLPALILYRMARYYISRKAPYGERGVLNWSDLGVVVLGQFLFTLLYTRLWHHHVEYVTRMKLRCPLAGEIFRLGMFLQTHPFAVSLSAIILLFVAWWSHKGKSALPRLYHLQWCCICAAVFISTLSLVPQVYEDMTRYWGWAAGLSEVQSTSFGTNIKLPFEEWAYPKFILQSVPDGLLLMLPFALYLIFKSWRTLDPKTKGIYLLLLLIPPIWIGILSVSSKRSVRYIIPLMPIICTLAVTGAAAVASYVQCLSKRLPLSRVAQILLLLSIAVQIPLDYPFFLLHRNFLSGGFRATVRSGHNEAFGSYALPAVIEPIVGLVGNDSPTTIHVEGNPQVWNNVISRVFYPLRRKVVFGDIPLKSTDFIINKLTSDPQKDLLRIEPELSGRVIFEYNHRGLTLFSVIDSRGVSPQH